MKKNEVNILKAFVFLALFLGLIILIFIYSKDKNSNEPKGWIVFKTLLRSELGSEELLEYEYYLMDGNGERIQWIWKYRGEPVWSPDGNFLAVSCEDNVNQICILDVSTFPDRRTWPRKEEIQRWTPSIAKIIDLPKDCAGLVSEEDGLESISWSHNLTQIAVVCGDRYANREGIQNTLRKLCVVGFDDNSSKCWENLPFDVFQAVWSPTEDILVLSKATLSTDEFELYLFDPVDETLDFLAKGISPAWSPDGKKVAFMGEITKAREVQESGIASVNKDGSGFYWLFENPEEYWQGFSVQCGFECKLTWSPDGQYIAFQGDANVGGLFEIFRLNIKTGEVICMTCFDQTHAYNSLPDWGLPNLTWE